MQVRVQGVSPSAERRIPQAVLICLLGSFKVLCKGQPVPLRSGGKAEALLCALALRNQRGLGKDRLIESLWPATDPILASQSLNSLVHSLHRLLGEALGGAPPVLHRGGWYQLNFAAGIGVDLVEFDELAETAQRLRQSGAHAAAAEAVHAAVDLCQGDLYASTDVAGLVERERVRARLLTLLAQLADHHFAIADYGACLAVVLRLLAVDACREDAQRLAMRIYVRRGERAQALGQYRLCASILASAFDAAPEPLTQALYERIRLDPDGV